MEKKKNANNIIISLGVVLVFIGIIFVSYNYLNSKIEKSYNKLNLELLALNNSEIPEEIDEPVNQVTEKKVKKHDPALYQYVGSIKIPKISLEQGFVGMKSKYNNVNYGIQVIKGSKYPNVNKGNFILAAHSGTSYISFFKNLYKLGLGDHCYIDYNGKTYDYKIVNIYYEPKIGKVAIERDMNKTTLTLITCTKNNKKTQTVYIAELVK